MPATQAEQLRRLGRDLARDPAALDQPAQVALVDIAGLEHPRRPAAPGDIKQQHARGVGHLGDLLAGQSPAQIVLGQQHRADPLPQLGLMALDPEQLGGGESDQGAIAGLLDDAGELPVQGGAFRCAAPIVPQDGRAHHRARAIEQGGAVHLAADADALDGLGRPFPDHLAHRGHQALPPMLRILLAPQRLGCAERVGCGGAGDDRPVAIDQHGLASRGSQVDAEDCHGVSLSCSGPAATPRSPGPLPGERARREGAEMGVGGAACARLNAPWIPDRCRWRS